MWYKNTWGGALVQKRFSFSRRRATNKLLLRRKKTPLSLFNLPLLRAFYRILAEVRLNLQRICQKWENKVSYSFSRNVSLCSQFAGLYSYDKRARKLCFFVCQLHCLTNFQQWIIFLQIKVNYFCFTGRENSSGNKKTTIWADVANTRGQTALFLQDELILVSFV